MLSAKMPSLVKGAGFATPGGVRPLDDDGQIFTRAMQAEKSLRASVRRSWKDPVGVRKSFNPAFTSQFGMFLQQDPAGQGMSSFVNELQAVLSAELGKNIQLTSPLLSGLVPYDLLAPSRLIYPVYSPLRNKIPRTPGQGMSHRTKVLTSIQGSGVGGSVGAATRLSIGEFPSGQSLNGNWPLNLPAAGNQYGVDVNIPYVFFGRTEALSWLAQFAGQGFEDVSALANLLLLQEFMLGEEWQILASTSGSVTAPAAPTLTARAPGSNESAGSGSADLFVCVTAATPFGETVASAVASINWISGASVVDVTIAPVTGAYFYNIYVTSSAASTAAASSCFLLAASVGGKKYTIQGVTVPTAGTHPPTADTGTYSSTDYEGLLSCLDGHGVVDGVYPAGFQGGYINKSVGTHLSLTALNVALQQLWDGPGAYRADPSELICEGGDAMRLSTDVVQSASAGGAGGYRIMLQQADVAGILACAVVSQVLNPVTRNPVNILVHPFLPQGTAFLNSYTLPLSWTNVANVFENVMVQDYLSVSWPVIDASFRYSMFSYGSFVCYAPQFCGLLQGLQVSDVTPYS